MKGNEHNLWLAAIAILTLILLIIIFPLLEAKYGALRSVLLSGLLVVGMLLYYLRGILLSQIKK